MLKLPEAPPLDNGLLLALELCRSEAYWHQAWAVAQGIGMALGEVPLEAFEAVCHDEEEARFQHDLHQARRRLGE